MRYDESTHLVRDFLLGFIRLHILYHASKSSIFGLEMIQELKHHGYALSPGTLYPILHGLERDGFLTSEKQVVNGKARKCYRATPSGLEALSKAKDKVRELMAEIDENRKNT